MPAPRTMEVYDKEAIDLIKADIDDIQTDVTTKHGEVSDDATAVSTMLGMAQDIQTDVTDKQTDVTTKHGEVSDDATAVATMLGMAQDIQTDVTDKQTDVTTKHGEVSDDATAVSTMLGMAQAIQTDVTDKQTDVTTKHGEVSDDATAVSTMLGMAQDIQTDVTDKQTDVTTKHGEVSDDATAVSTMLGMAQDIQTDVTDKQTDVTTKHGEVSDDATAVSTMLGMVQALFDTIQGWFNTISGWYTQMEAWYNQTSTNTTAAANSAATANSAASQAANIVFAGSTDFPTVPPVFSWHCDSGELDPRIDLSYTGNLSVTDQRGVLRSVPQGARALDYDPVTRACLGLLAWEGRTNIFLYSEDFTNAVWTKTRAIITNVAVPNPRRSTSEKLVWDGVTGVAYVYQTRNVTSGQAYTVSFLAKAAEANEVHLVFYSTNSAFSPGGTIFNLQTGAAVSSTGPVINHPSVNFGDGWWRFSVTNVATATTTGNVSVGLNVATNTINQGIYVATASLEAGSAPGPYIPTTGAVASRGTVVGQIQGAAFNSIFSGLKEFTMVLEVNILTTGLDQHLLTYLYDGNNFYSFRKSAGGLLAVNIRQSGQASGDINFLGNYTTGLFRFAAKFKPGDFRASLNGGSVLVSLSPNTFVPNRLFVGSQTGTSTGGQYIRQIAIYGPGITDAQLQALSRL